MGVGQLALEGSLGLGGPGPGLARLSLGPPAGRKGGHESFHSGRKYEKQEYIFGLANQFTFVELERDGIWKVSVPSGQRFSKQFLAGVEVWASQMMELGKGMPVPAPPPPPPQPTSAGPFKQDRSACAPADGTALNLSSILDALPSLPTPQQPVGQRTVPTPPSKKSAPSPSSKKRVPTPSSKDTTYEYQDMQAAVLKGDCAEGDTEDELSSGEGASDEEFHQGSDSSDEDMDPAAASANPDPAASKGGPSTSAKKQPPTKRPAKGKAASPLTTSGSTGTPVPSRETTSGQAVVTKTTTAKHTGKGLKVKVSLHLERQNLTDVEMCLVAKWYKERVSHSVELSKLWLFDNRLGDLGAEACADLLYEGTKEVHLSHNFITTEGAKLLLARCPTKRTPGLKPLWLRMEWNLISPDELCGKFLADQKKERALVVDVPQVVKAGKNHDHEMHLRISRTPLLGVHVQLPWLACQKQAPSESALLQDTKSAYNKPSNATPAAGKPRHVGSTAPSPVPGKKTQQVASTKMAFGLPDSLCLPPAGTLVGGTAPSPVPGKKTQQAASTTIEPPESLCVPPFRHVGGTTPSPVPGKKTQQTASTSSAPSPSPQPAASYQGGVVDGDGRDGGYRSGPLLIFPDTSALLSMLGANIDLARPSITMDILQRLAQEGRFGRVGLNSSDRIFIVIADSVMKQLDSLKALSTTRVAIRKFLSEGLEAMGPAGTDFLTVLGAHEGEGLLLESGGLGVDYKIVEVAMFFQKEVVKSASSVNPDDPTVALKPLLPVMLLSNDNAQITIARAHGLPAFRLSSPEDVPEKMKEFIPGIKGPALTAGSLRAMLAPQATRGLGTVAGQSLQHQFDEAISTMRALASSLRLATSTLDRVAGAVSSTNAHTDAGAGAAMSSIRQMLLLPSSTPPEEAGGGNSNDMEPPLEPGSSPIVLSLEEMADAVEGQLAEWETLVRSHQAPSRVAQWAAAT
eukprot:gene13398-19251_t